MGYRWNTYLVNFDSAIGSEQGKTRPVLVISDDVNAILPVINSLPIDKKRLIKKIGEIKNDDVKNEIIDALIFQLGL